MIEMIDSRIYPFMTVDVLVLFMASSVYSLVLGSSYASLTCLIIDTFVIFSP